LRSKSERKSAAVCWKGTIIGLRPVTIMLSQGCEADSVAVTVQRPRLHFGAAAYAFSGQGKCSVDLAYAVGRDQFQKIAGNVLLQTANSQWLNLVI
jgi:hypothetical protein